ncbi:biopolymer transporter ExbD [beta proteobacterium MWH-UniP1]
MAIPTASDDDDVMAEMNVTPLVDVMLVLLVIFIITAPLIVPQSMKIVLPKTQAVAQQDMAKNVSLVINAQGEMRLDGRVVDEAELGATLKARASEPKFQLQVQADEKVPYGRVAQVMAVAQGNGVTRLSFVTLPR